MDPDIQRSISACKMRLRTRSPYFSVLAGYIKSSQVASGSWITTAATDGRNLYVCGEFWRRLSAEDADFVYLHEVVHAALGHTWRCGRRNRHIWNLAADYVDNIICCDALKKKPPNITMPSGEVAVPYYSDEYRGMTVEEVYVILMRNCEECANCMVLADLVVSEEGASKGEPYWRAAIARAKEVTKSMGPDPLLGIIEAQVIKSNFDWRKYLWNHLSYSSADFTTWDRRLLGQEIYSEDLEPEKNKLACHIFLDSSGSMLEIVGKLVGEVEQIAALYPQLDIKAYFADADVYGPVPLHNLRDIRGGGGTSFVPAFELAEEEGADRVIYMTDLMGEFPDFLPKADTTWAVPAGCNIVPPFGKVIKVL